MGNQITEIEGQKVRFCVRQSSRAKTPNLKLKNGKIIVTVPESSNLHPEQLLQKNPEWVLKHWEKAKEFREDIPDRKFEEGEDLSVLGENKEIVVEKRRSNSINERIYLAEHLIEQTSLKDQLEKALKDYARDVFEDKSEKYSDRINKDFDRIFIRDQKTRWGSCSSKGNLNFNWRLIFGPKHVLEYVVVHELVHLEQSNHSREFWSRVEQMYPGYRKSDDWLSENGAKLVFDSDLEI